MIIFQNWNQLICLKLIKTAKINITKIKLCIAFIFRITYLTHKWDAVLPHVRVVNNRNKFSLRYSLIVTVYFDVRHFVCMSHVYGHTSLPLVMICGINVLGTTVWRRTVYLRILFLPFQNGGHFVGLFPKYGQRLNQFSWNFDYLDRFIDRVNRGVFVLIWESGIFMCVYCMSNAFTNCHTIWIQHTCYKDRMTIRKIFFIPLPFKKGDRFVCLIGNHGIECGPQNLNNISAYSNTNLKIIIIKPTYKYVNSKFSLVNILDLGVSRKVRFCT